MHVCVCVCRWTAQSDERVQRLVRERIGFRRVFAALSASRRWPYGEQTGREERDSQRDPERERERDREGKRGRVQRGGVCTCAFGWREGAVRLKRCVW